MATEGVRRRGHDLKGTAGASGDSVGGGQMIEVEHRKIFYIYLQLYIYIKYTTYKITQNYMYDICILHRNIHAYTCIHRHIHIHTYGWKRSYATWSNNGIKNHELSNKLQYRALEIPSQVVGQDSPKFWKQYYCIVLYCTVLRYTVLYCCCHRLPSRILR